MHGLKSEFFPVTGCANETAVAICCFNSNPIPVTWPQPVRQSDREKKEFSETPRGPLCKLLIAGVLPQENWIFSLAPLRPLDCCKLFVLKPCGCRDPLTVSVLQVCVDERSQLITKRLTELKYLHDDRYCSAMTDLHSSGRI